MAGLLGLDASVFSTDLYLQIHLVSKNYDTINILRMAKSSYFWFKKNSYLEYANNNLRIYAYSAIQPSNYLVDRVGLRKLMLGLKGELKQDLLRIHHANLFKWQEDIGILGIFKEEFNMYVYYLRKTAREEKDSILQTICHSLL